MSVAVSGKNVELTEGLVETVERKVERLGRHVGGVRRAEVRFVEERNPRISDKDVCDLVLVGSGRRVVRVRAAAADPAEALDRVLGKALHKVEKLKPH